MNNTIVVKNYDEFINHLSIEFRRRLDALQWYRDTGKLYQDMFLWNIKNTTIWLSSKCTNTIDKQKELLTVVLSKLPLLDDSLCNELRDIKNYYTNKNNTLDKPSYKNLENYCNDKLYNYCKNNKVSFEEIDRDLKDRLLKWYNNEYKNTYQPQKNNEFQIRSFQLRKYLEEDKKIQKIVENRLETNKNHYIKHSDEQIKDFEKEIHILTQKNNYNNQVIQYIEQLENKKENYIQRRQEIENETLSHKETKFREKLVDLAHHYITSSHEHENKNLRERYVKLFILDDYWKYIHFQKNDTSEYSFLLWSSPLEMIEKKRQEITLLLNAKPIQLSFDFLNY